MADIVLDNVIKRYSDGFEAVKDLNLEIADGEFMILVGPSGCGKSTALNMIAGLEDISAGELRIGGEVVNQKAPRDRDIAMVFQSYALYPHMTVRENMAFALKLAKTPEGGDRPQGQRGGGHPRPQRAPRAQAGQPLRRPAPARGHGPRDRARPEGVPDGRAAVEPRRQAARADARRGGAHPAPAEHHHGLRHPRPDRGHDARATASRSCSAASCSRSRSPMELYNNPANLFVAGLHRLARHELPAGDDRRRRGASCRWSTSRCRRRSLERIGRVDGEPEADRRHPARGLRGREPGRGRDPRPRARRSRRSSTSSRRWARSTTSTSASRPTAAAVRRQVEELHGRRRAAWPRQSDRARPSSSPGWTPRAARKVGEPTEVWLDATKLHFFDADSGRVLSPVVAG